MKRAALDILIKNNSLSLAGFSSIARKHIKKRQIIKAILWLCWGVLLFAGFSNVNRLSAVYPTVSLRYDEPISHRMATNARKYAADASDETPFWPTFWTEQQNMKLEGLHSATTRCLWFSGDAALVWSADFLQGGYPSPLDETGCSISNTLAWQLWGTEDAVGYELTIDNQKYTVHGVLYEADLLVLASVGNSAFAGGWQSVELAGTPDGEARAAALDFAQVSGLGAPTTLVDGAAITGFAGFLAALPVVMVLLVLLILLLRLLAKALHGKGWVLITVVLLILALALPTLLESLPPSFIPTRFSDFAFWGRLTTTTWEHIKEWLLLHPHYIDLRAKLLLGAQMVFFVAQGSIGVISLVGSFWEKRGKHNSLIF